MASCGGMYFGGKRRGKEMIPLPCLHNWTARRDRGRVVWTCLECGKSVILALLLVCSPAYASSHVSVEIHTESPATPVECPCVKTYDPQINTVTAECRC